MTKNSRRLLPCLIFIVLTIVACNKVADFLRNNKDGDIKYCNIKTYKFVWGELRTFTFTYNAQGYPLTAIVDKPATSLPSRFFTYDNKGRLIRQVGAYINWNYGNFEFYYKYIHDAKGRIIQDTSWGFGSLAPDGSMATSAWGYGVTDYTYDKHDRIIKTSYQAYLGYYTPPIVTEFAYDEDGNQVREGIVYDNKINANRTNKIWMFVNNDYSVNNPYKSKTYNHNNLPLKTGLTYKTNPPYQFFNHEMEQAEFEYMCK